MKAKERVKFAAELSKRCNLQCQKQYGISYRLIENNGLYVVIGIEFSNTFNPNKLQMQYVIQGLYQRWAGWTISGWIGSKHFTVDEIDAAVTIAEKFYNEKLASFETLPELFELLKAGVLNIGSGEETRLMDLGYLAVGLQQYDQALSLFHDSKKIYDKYPQYNDDNYYYHGMLAVMELIKTQQYDRLHSQLLAWQQETFKTLRLPHPK